MYTQKSMYTSKVETIILYTSQVYTLSAWAATHHAQWARPDLADRKINQSHITQYHIADINNRLTPKELQILL